MNSICGLLNRERYRRLKKWGLFIVSVLVTGSMLVNGVQAQTPKQPVPAPSDVSGAQYSRILSDHRVIFQVEAPCAMKVQIDLGKLPSRGGDISRRKNMP